MMSNHVKLWTEQKKKFIKMTVYNNKLQYSLLNVEKPLPTMLKIQIRSLNDAFPSCVEYIR